MSAIKQRLNDLFTVLVYCSDRQQLGKSSVFTEFERILINQERGAILSQLQTERIDPIRTFKVPFKLAAKVTFNLTKAIDEGQIKQTDEFRN